MRRSRAVDWWLLATLLPAYLFLLYAGISEQLWTGARVLPLTVTGAQGEHGYPIVVGLATSDSAIQPGDRLLRLADIDLEGLSAAEIRYRALPLRREGGPFEVVLERDGGRFTAIVAPIPNPYWWWMIPVWATFALAAVFLLLRAQHWHLARRFFVAFLLWCCYGAAALSRHPAVVFLGVVAAQSTAMGVTLRLIFDWAESASPGHWSRALPWAIGLAFAGNMTASQ